MHTRVPHLVLSSLLLSGLVSACDGDGTGSGGGGGGRGSDSGDVVFGVRSKLVPAVHLDSLRIVIEADGEVVLDEERDEGTGALKFPFEVRAEDVGAGKHVEASFTGIKNGVPVITRLASTEAAGGKDLLLELELEYACLQEPGSGLPTCDAPTTCIKAACQSGHVAPEKLQEYDPSWSTTTVDVCKPQGAGDPVVVIGQGQADYLPMSDGAVAQVEAGPQGGHHIWVAVRTKNLTQSGTITSLTGHFPDLGYDVGPFDVIFSFDPDEGGYCKLYGLRFQLDTKHDIQEMLGKTFEVRAKLTDKDKDTGTATRTVKLSDDIIGL